MKNFNQLLLNLNIKEVDFLINLLNDELNKSLKTNTYKSEFLFKLNLTINSLFFLIYINNQSVIKDFLELNMFSTFSIKNLNFFIKNLTKELLLNKEDIYKVWYIIFYINNISKNLNIFIKNDKYCNIFFQFYFEKLNVEKLKDLILIYINNIVNLTNTTQKFLRKNKINNKKLNNLSVLEKNNNIALDPLKLNLFLQEFLSKKYNIFLKNKCSQQLSFLNDLSFFLIKVNLFYENKLIVEFGQKYWSNSSLNLNYLKKKVYDQILLNTACLNLEFDFKSNMLINVFFKNKKFHIKKNNYSIDNSVFDFQKIKIINNKLKKKVYYTDVTIFLKLFNFFEKFLLKITFEKKIDTLENCIKFFEENIEKINNFNFFNIEAIDAEEQEKYSIFFSIFNLYVWTYKNYINEVIIPTEFLNYFYKKTDIEELLNCIKKEEENLFIILHDNNMLNFEKLNYVVKIIKNLILFLNNTTEINMKDVSNNNYDSNYFLKIEYCEYIIFLNKFKILISYLEQIITIFNLKQKIIENNLNKKKLFGIEIKLDFRGRLYSIDIVKAYDNNKLLRQSMKIKNTIKINKLMTWYSDLYKKLNINLSFFIKEDTYDFILKQKEFNKFSYLFNLNIETLNKKDFLNLLYLKTSMSTLIYIGFLLLSSEKKKTYSTIEILKQGYNFFYKNNCLNTFENAFDNVKIKNLNIENYLELTEAFNSLLLINKNINFNNLLLNNKLLTLDSSCNGYTHLLYTFSELNEEKFKQFKKVLNLTNDNINYDFYSEVLNEIKNYDSFLKEQIENKIIDRNSIKKIVMTIPYNAKEFSFYEKLKSEILEKNKEKKEKIIKNLVNFFSKNFKNKIINKTFIIKLKDFLKKNKIKNIWYVIDENTKINITYFKQKNEKIPFIDNILNKKKSVYIKILTNELDIEKTVTASVANIIHANDAYVIKELILKSSLNILTIHDCIKFDSFLFEEILFLYEHTFKSFYKNYSIYDKLYYETFDSNVLYKIFNEKNNLNSENILTFEKSKYILKL